MIFREEKSLLAEEMELIITIGLELGTAIERMQNREELRRSEIKNEILFKHIPFSIFRITEDGNMLDVKLDKKLEKIMGQNFDLEQFTGKNIDKFLPPEILAEAQKKIGESIEHNRTVEMKFILPFNDNKMILQANIVPLGNNEVLVFLQNVSRVW